MLTINELRKQILQAKKEGDKEKSLVLTTFLENAQKIAKADKNREIKDSDIVDGIKREIKMAEQSRDAGAPYSQLVFNLGEQYLPKTISEDELKDLIQNIITNNVNANMGLIMKELKSSGKEIDMKIASQLIKTLL